MKLPLTIILIITVIIGCSTRENVIGEKKLFDQLTYKINHYLKDDLKYSNNDDYSLNYSEDNMAIINLLVIMDGRKEKSGKDIEEIINHVKEIKNNGKYNGSIDVKIFKTHSIDRFGYGIYTDLVKSLVL